MYSRLRVWLVAKHATLLRFLIVGVLNAAVGLGGIAMAQFLFGWSYVVANAFGYCLGLINSFFWNKFWTFDSKNWQGRELVKFMIVFAISYAVQLGAVTLLVDAANAPVFLSQIMGIGSYTAVNYALNKYWTFRHAGRE